MSGRAAHEAMKLAMEISMKRLLDALDLFPRPRWGGRRLRRARRRRIAANRARRRFRHGHFRCYVLSTGERVFDADDNEGRARVQEALSERLTKGGLAVPLGGDS